MAILNTKAIFYYCTNQDQRVTINARVTEFSSTPERNVKKKAVAGKRMIVLHPLNQSLHVRVFQAALAKKIVKLSFTNYSSVFSATPVLKDPATNSLFEETTVAATKRFLTFPGRLLCASQYCIY